MLLQFGGFRPKYALLEVRHLPEFRFSDSITIICIVANKASVLELVEIRAMMLVSRDLSLLLVRYTFGILGRSWSLPRLSD